MKQTTPRLRKITLKDAEATDEYVAAVDRVIASFAGLYIYTRSPWNAPSWEILAWPKQ